MNKRILVLMIVITVAVLWRCTTPFTPPTTTTNVNVLVVEGIINTGKDSTVIKLSRTVIVSNKTLANPETKAVVTIENAQATVGTLTEITKGLYASAGLNLDNTKQYRIRIKTNNGKTYLSDLIAAKVTPPIDSVSYAINNKGLQLYANAHDPANNTRYYLYTFGETWKFHAKYNSDYISNGSAIVTRTTSQLIYTCFTRDSSVNILLNSTAALSQDVVYQFPLTTIDATSEKIENRYSILLRQFALTKEAYAFYNNMKKNTEQLGSIFDAEPSQIAGNIHNVNDPGEPVIGYMSAGTTTTKRIFIDSSMLPSNWTPAYPFTCSEDTAYFCVPKSNPCQNDVQSILIPVPGTGALVTRPFFVGPSPVPTGYLYSSPQCADCTIRGTTKQPAFWK